MELQKITTPDLQTYVEKIGVYQSDLQQTMQLCINAKKSSRHFDLDKYGKSLVNKLTACQETYNAIQLELESRILRDLKLNLEYEKFTNITIKAKNAIANASIIESKKQPLKVVKPKKNDQNK